MIRDVNGVNSNLSSSAARNNKTNNAAPSGEASSTNASGSKDKVSLSAEAQLLGKVKDIVAALPDVDLARVEKFKSAIANGEYQVDNEKLAENILRSEND